MSDKLIVQRNGISLPLVMREKKKGDKKPYWGLDLNKENLLTEVIPFFGDEYVYKILSARANLLAQGATEQATDDSTGRIDNEAVVKFIQDLSVRGEKIDDLKEEHDEAVALMAEMFPKLQAEMAQGIQNGPVAKELEGLFKEIQTLKEEIARKSRKGKNKESQEATPVAA